jgi:hypothetical protein
MRRTSVTLEWHHVSVHDMPDADLTVMLWISDPTGLSQPDWDRGWWDGEVWRLAESGGACAGTVVAWAEPEGPAA